MVLVTTYYKDLDKDVLILQLKNSTQQISSESQDGVTRIFEEDSNETLGYNFFNIGDQLGISEKGPVTLSVDDIAVLNNVLTKAGFQDVLEADESPKFVVGYVQSCEKMEDSDHLNITQTEVDQGEVLQIVCGAANIQEGQKVVVAKEGAIMPDGMVIWNGQLRGTPSHGMICSARELGLKNAGQKRGILVLDEDAKVGEPFDF